MKNITPKEEALVRSERIKIIIMHNGDQIIADIQEAVNKETNQRQAYILNFPYRVEYDQPKLDGTGIVSDPEVRVNYSPWCPLTPETRIPINHNMVVSIVEPVPSLRDTYITNVRKMGGNVE